MVGKFSVLPHWSGRCLLHRFDASQKCNHFVYRSVPPELVPQVVATFPHQEQIFGAGTTSTTFGNQMMVIPRFWSLVVSHLPLLPSLAVSPCLLAHLGTFGFGTSTIQVIPQVSHFITKVFSSSIGSSIRWLILPWLWHLGHSIFSPDIGPP